MESCKYCGNGFKKVLSDSAKEYYPEACVECISDFIDFMVQYNSELLDQDNEINKYFNGEYPFRDRWINTSERIMVNPDRIA